MEDRMLGFCANLQESFAYFAKSVSSDKFDRLADLRDHLVDATKQGHRFSYSDWMSFLKQHGLQQRYPTPAYKSTGATRSGQTPTNHIVDQLKFEVILPITTEFLSCAMERLQPAVFEDHYLDGLCTSKYDMSCQNDLTEIRYNLEWLQYDVDCLIENWRSLRENATGLQDYELHIEQAYQRYLRITPRENTHILAEEWGRGALPSLPSIWSLLKVSAMHASVTKLRLARSKNVVTEHFLFALAGDELLYMKSYENKAAALTVVPGVYKSMKMSKRRHLSQKDVG